MLMGAGILFGEMVVVAVRVMVEAAVGVMSLFEKRCLPVSEVEVECFGVSFGLVGGDIFDLGGGFVFAVVEMEMDNLRLEVGAVVRLVWESEWEAVLFVTFESNVRESPFGMAMPEDFLMELFFFDGGCLGKVIGSEMEVVVVEVDELISGRCWRWL